MPPAKSAKEVFLAALAQPGADRPAFLDDACGSDSGLRAAVERLLEGHDRPNSLFDPCPTSDPLATGQAGLIVGDRYKLIEPIGEGGMGEVWVAQQMEPVRRAVAIKLIKPGMDSKQVLARFEAERQALALMDHPNIAKIFDAGATSAGRPFFVIELVKGKPITQFCDARQLTPRQRLELFLPVCNAIQHAHQKGIIHRDIKPPNVLVALYDDRPVPKVIDFGVAKAAGQPLTDRTLMTAFGAVVGTLEYMSPEQATFNSLDVDTRTDVYALGVLLYELLTGATPFEKKRGTDSPLEFLRVLRDEEPSRPSTRLSSAQTLPAIAAARGTEPRKLAGLLRGELDWIVMRALEKDRTRRYETVNALTMDVERYLAGEPVRAAPPSAWYRVRKFVRRHRAPVIGAALVLLALIGGVIGTTIGLIRAEHSRVEAFEGQKAAVLQAKQAERARQRAEAEREAAHELAGFLQYDILGQADVRQQAAWREVINPDLTVREALDQAAIKVDRQRGWTKRAEAVVRWAIGDAYVGLGQPEKAVPQLEQACQLLTEDPEFGPAHEETVYGMHKLASAYRAAGRPELALPLSQQALKYSLARYDRVPSDTQGPWLAMLNVGLAHRDAGQVGEAVRQFKEAEHWAESKYAPGLTEAQWHLGDAYRAAGQPTEARRLLTDLLARTEKGTDDLSTAHCQSSLAEVLADAGELPAAQRMLRDCLEIRQRRQPKEWTTSYTSARLGAVLLGQKLFDEAEPLLHDGYREMKAREATIPTMLRYRLGEAAGWVADFYAARGNETEAAKWRAEQAQYPSAPQPAK